MTGDDVTRIAGAAPTAFAAADASTEDVVELARKFSPNAMRVLALVAATGKSETARVAAAAKIIEIDRASRNTDAPVLENAPEPVPDLPPIHERYPLLRNAL